MQDSDLDRIVRAHGRDGHPGERRAERAAPGTALRLIW